MKPRPRCDAVVIEKKLIKVDQMQPDHQMMTNLYSKHTELFRVALISSER